MISKDCNHQEHVTDVKRTLAVVPHIRPIAVYYARSFTVCFWLSCRSQLSNRLFRKIKMFREGTIHSWTFFPGNGYRPYQKFKYVNLSGVWVNSGVDDGRFLCMVAVVVRSCSDRWRRSLVALLVVHTRLLGRLCLSAASVARAQFRRSGDWLTDWLITGHRNRDRPWYVRSMAIYRCHGAVLSSFSKASVNLQLPLHLVMTGTIMRMK